MYLAFFFTIPLLKITRLGEKNCEGNWVQWERFYDLEVSLFPPLLQQPAGIHTGFHWFRVSTSCPLLHTPDLCPISRSQSNQLLFPQGDYGAGQMASRMHLGTAVASAHSSQHNTHTYVHTEQTQTHQSSSKHQQLGDNEKGTWLLSSLHGFCPGEILENKPHKQRKLSTKARKHFSLFSDWKGLNPPFLQL